MPKAAKVERVTALKERIEGTSALLLADYRGLTVSEITTLRSALLESGTSFTVVKNTLMQRAVADVGIEGMEAMLAGPSAVAFVHGDPILAAKRVVAASKEYPALELKGAWLDGQVLSADQARALADLEPRDVMLSKVAGLLKADMARAAFAFQAAQSKFLAVLAAFKDKLPGAPADQEETSASESPAEAAAPSTEEETPAAEATDEEAPAAATEDAPTEPEATPEPEEKPEEPEEKPEETPEETKE